MFWPIYIASRGLMAVDVRATLDAQENEGESERTFRMARQRFQEGCVFKRGRKRKVWVARWREWVIGSGGKLERIQRSEVLGAASELTRSDAQKKLLAKLDNAGKAAIETRITLSEFVENWWKPALLPTFKYSTKQKYQLALKNYLIPKFGNFGLSDIRKVEIQTFLGKLSGDLAPDTLHGLHACIRRILQSAIEWKYLQENPARGIKLPPARRREPPFITPGQFQRLLEALPGKVRLMVLLAMMTSMRIGEILGLRWGRVDLDRGVLRVAESCYRGNFSDVKTKRSERVIPLCLTLWNSLRAWKELSKAEPLDLVFATRTKGSLSDKNLLSRYVYPGCDALKIPRISWHMFRHLHGTLLSQLGVPVAVAQAQLGHADPRITLQIYTHVFPDAQRDAVDRLERFLLFPNVPKLTSGGGVEQAGRIVNG